MPYSWPISLRYPSTDPCNIRLDFYPLFPYNTCMEDNNLTPVSAPPPRIRGSKYEEILEVVRENPGQWYLINRGKKGLVAYLRERFPDYSFTERTDNKTKEKSLYVCYKVPTDPQ